LKQRSALLLSLGVIIVLLISACGGGGGATTRRLTVNITGNGSVISDPAGIDEDTTQFSFPNNTPVTLTATPDDNEAVIWGGACEGATGNTCELIMNADKTVSVTFAEAQTLTVTKDGTGSGTVTSNPAGIDCGDTCEAQFENGSTVVLTATPASGSQPVVWGGACSGATGNTCSVTMDDAKTVTATFNVPPGQQQLAVTKTGLGTVTSSPAGINCGNTCTNSFNEGVTVTLNASPANGEAVIWGGACEGAEGNSCTVTMSEARNVSVAFTFEVTITKAGTGSGTVTSDPAGIDCGSTCTANLPSGTEVTFTGTADSGSRFDGWDGDCTGEECVLTIDGNKAITATFTEVVTLTVTRQGNGTGTVTSQPAGINCGDTCAAGFDIGGTVTLTANVNLPNYIASWGGACAGTTGASCTVTMSEAKSVSVTFEEASGGPFTLNATLSGVDTSGTTVRARLTIRNESTSPAQVFTVTNLSSLPFSNAFDAGARITIRAEAVGGTTVFDGFTGCDSVQGDTCTITMLENKSVTASYFRRTVDLRGADGNADAEEFLEGTSSGEVRLDSDVLRLAYRTEINAQQLVGLRFGLPVPQGAEIIDAYIQFTSSAAQSGPVSLEIRAEDSDNAPAFTADPDNLSSRAKTAPRSEGNWVPPTWANGERNENTRVEVTSLVQSIVNRGGWAEGNNIAFFIQRAPSTTGINFRQAHSRDSGIANSPFLVVIFRIP
jgi:hypothetical protein